MLIISFMILMTIIQLATGQSGCSIASRGYSNSEEIIANSIYACAGTIDQGSGGLYGEGPGSAAALCSSGYHVCESANEAAALGLTHEMCKNIGSTTSFFGTKETRGTANAACLSNGATLTTNDFWAYNDVYGCGAGATGVECVVFTKWIGNSDWYNWKLSGTYDQGLGQDEAQAIYLTDASSGGVLCCADQAPLTGCSNGEYNSEEVIEDRIYACAGEIEQGTGGMYGTGDGSAAALCSSGYHICESSNELKTLGMTLSICGGIGSAREFFGTQETRGTGAGTCLSNGGTITTNDFWAYNDVYGCGGGATGSECGVLTKWIGNSDWYNWRISGTYDQGLGQDEANAIYLTNSMSGGVLCCTDYVPLTGCSDESKAEGNSREVIEDKIYACAGTIDQGNGGMFGEGDGSAAALCSSGYHVCESANEAESLGLTHEMCKNIGSTTEFFGTQETRGTANAACLSKGATITTNDFWAYNDVYGCGAGATGSECGAFTKWIGNADWYNWKISGTYDEGKGQDEANVIYLTDASSGGVLCCADPVVERGCSEAEYNSQEIIADTIYACAGTIDMGSGGMYGIGDGSAQAICASDYHVCDSATELESLGMTHEMCKNIGSTYSFFGTKETRGTGAGTCLSKGGVITENDFWAYNDVYGCGAGATGSECGILTKWIGNADWYNWRISGTYDEGIGTDEALVIYLDDPMSGGVLCCAGQCTSDANCVDNASCNGNNECECDFGYEEDSYGECKLIAAGCSAASKAYDNSEEIIADKIYACAGTIDQGTGGVYGKGDGSAAALCDDMYHVCDSAAEVASLGMTLEMCAAIGSPTEFFGTQETRGTGTINCVSSGAPITVNDGWAYNDIFGCGGGATTSACGVLTFWVGNYDWNDWIISGTYDDGVGQDEALAMYLADAASGGVLCCVGQCTQDTDCGDNEVCNVNNECECEDGYEEDETGTCQLRAAGCSASSRSYENSVEIIEDTIYACAGTIDQGSGGMYGEGAGSAAALCRSGYHVCESADEASTLGLTHEMCKNIGSTTSFFGTKETRGTANAACLSNGATITTNDFWAYNDIYGCGAGATGSECGVFTKWIGNNDWYNWKISGTSDEGAGVDEALVMYLTDASSGGVLCCADQAPLAGCANGEYNSEEVIANKIYACAGEIEQDTGGMYGSGDGSAAALCASNYHLCESANEVEELGMTLAMCGSIGTSRSFFATKETRGTGAGTCLSKGGVITENDFWAYNDVYGCGAGATGSECGVLTKWIGNSDWYNWRISGTYDQGLGQDEANVIYLTNSMSGGVLCCAGPGTTTPAPTTPRPTTPAPTTPAPTTPAPTTPKPSTPEPEPATPTTAPTFEPCSDDTVEMNVNFIMDKSEYISAFGYSRMINFVQALIEYSINDISVVSALSYSHNVEDLYYFMDDQTSRDDILSALEAERSNYVGGGADTYQAVMRGIDMFSEDGVIANPSGNLMFLATPGYPDDALCEYDGTPTAKGQILIEELDERNIDLHLVGIGGASFNKENIECLTSNRIKRVAGFNSDRFKAIEEEIRALLCPNQSS